jgi:hypothetical protein
LVERVVEFAGSPEDSAETFECVSLVTRVVTDPRLSNPPTDRVAELIGQLHRERFVDFCVSLWAARGDETRVEDGRIVATRANERIVLLPWTDPGALGRALGAVRAGVTGWGRDTADGGVDVVVAAVDAAPARRLAARHDARFVGPTALADRLLYGVSRAEAAELVAMYLDEELSAVLATTSSPHRTNIGIDATTLVAVAGVVCLVVAGIVGGVWTVDGPDATADGATGSSPTTFTTGVPPTETDVQSGGSTTGDAAGDGSTIGRYPPGVAEGFLDVWVLSNAHAEAIDGRSYRLIVRHSGGGAFDGDRRWNGAWQHAVVGDDGTWLYSVVGYADRGNDSELVQYTVYADGSAAYRRADGREGPTYERSPVPVTDDGFGPHTELTQEYLRRYLATPEVRVDRPSWNPEVYRLVATGPPSTADRDVSNYTATALVSEAGFVSELTVEYTLVEADDERTVRFRFEYAAVDETTVRPPGWYDEAVVATGNASRA